MPIEMDQNFARVNGTRLYFESRGEGEALVLLHGFGGDVRIWDGQFESLSSLCRVIRYDLRGFGKSDLPTDESFRPIDDLKALLKHLGISRAAILGQSMGGEVAIDFAVTYPEMTRALIACDTAPRGYEMPPEFNEWFGSYFAEAQVNGPKAATRLMLTIPVMDADMANPERARRIEALANDYSGWHWLNNAPEQFIEAPAHQRLESIHAPTLLLVGERDHSAYRNAIDEIHRRIPHAQKAVIADAGHMPMFSHPVEFNQLVVDFLQRI